ncbi:MAG: amidohydrolase [Bacteroidota bacterium]
MRLFTNELSINMSMILLLLFLALTSCEDEAPVPNEPPTNSDYQVYFNGRIYTMNPDQPWAEVMVVERGVITHVGSSAEGHSGTGTNPELIDLEGAFVMPGIHDVHLHPLEASTENFQFILDDSVEDADLYADDVADAMAENPGSSWLLGWGHWIDVPLNATRLPKTILDDVAPNRPVAIMEQTSHSVWCNSRALELMGINEDTSDPPGGIIVREPNGEASGLLIDNAGNLLLDLALAATPERTENDYLGLVEFGLPELAKNGITSICDARTYWLRDHHLVWQRLASEKALTARVVLGLWAYPDEEDSSQLSTLKNLYSNDPSSLLRINQIKLYSDGIVHNTTCAMHDDFLIDYFGLPTNNGLNYFTEDRIAAYISELEPIGFDFHIHTIGNRGVYEALNAVEAAGSSSGRHRLTHVEYVDPIDYHRFAQLNVTADAQVVGDFAQPQNWQDNNYFVGAALNQANIPLRSLHEANARITLSSDWDVSALNPFVGLQNAVTRDPQALSLEEALKAYTINAAYVMRQEQLVGSIEEGKEADFIVLDRNLFDISPTQISRTKVLETYLRGELVYQR